MYQYTTYSVILTSGAFRLYDRDIPEIPLVLDYYAGSDAVVSGALYERPYEKDPREEMLWLEAMREAALTGGQRLSAVE
jgi:23S rRNA G2069 N7-methylase RlmK/C1962 C5-methylase RlmI